MIIGMLGAKGSGKDTAAKVLMRSGACRIGFADALYKEVAQAYGITVEMLQRRETKEKLLASLAFRHCRDANFVRVALEVLGGNEHTPHSPREILQVWGTEYRRRSPGSKDSYWLDQVFNFIKQDAKTQTRDYIITDVRFKNEANAVKENGGVLIRVRQREVEAKEAAERAAGGRAVHPSETELLEFPVDAEIENVWGQPGLLGDNLLKVLAGLKGLNQAAA